MNVAALASYWVHIDCKESPRSGKIRHPGQCFWLAWQQRAQGSGRESRGRESVNDRPFHARNDGKDKFEVEA
jgi:hypothetical protein